MFTCLLIWILVVSPLTINPTAALNYTLNYTINYTFPSKTDATSSISLVKDFFSPILALVGIVVGVILTPFVGLLKDRPFNNKMKRLVSHELNKYKTFLDKSIFNNNLGKPNETEIQIDPKKSDDLKTSLTDFSVSHFETIPTDKKLQVFNAESMYNLEMAYKNLGELKKLLSDELSKPDLGVIEVPKEKTLHTYKAIKEALKALN